MFFRSLVFLTVILCVSCTKSKSPDQNHLVIIIEERKFPEDQIIEKRFYTDGLLNTSVLHDSNDSTKTNLFSSEFKTLSSSEQKKFNKFLEEIKATEHHNEFPWREDFYKKGNIIKVQFPKLKKLEFLAAALNGETLENEVLVLETRFYYEGQDFPDALEGILGL